MSENIPDAAFLEALSMIDVGRWGRVRHSIVVQVRADEARHEDGWARLSRRALTAGAGCSDRFVWDLIGPRGRLWKVDRVLSRVAGRRRRVSLLRVNRPELWRGIPWAEPDPDKVRLRLALADAQAVMARSISAPNNIVMARPNHRAITPVPPEVMARSMSAPKPILFGAMGGAYSAPKQDEPAPPVQLHGSSKEELSLEAKSEREEGAYGTVEAALRAKTGGWVGGRLVGALSALVAEHESSALVAAVQTAPAGMGVPAIVETWLPAVVSGRAATASQRANCRDCGVFLPQRWCMYATCTSASEHGDWVGEAEA